jgi:hypothetical protein
MIYIGTWNGTTVLKTGRMNEIAETNKELDELIKQRNIISYVKSQRISCFGNINRMSETNIVRKIYKWKPFTSRPVGRPKS